MRLIMIVLIALFIPVYGEVKTEAYTMATSEAAKWS